MVRIGPKALWIVSLTAIISYGVQVMTEAGPWHARLLQMGAEHMAALHQQFMAGYPCPEHGPIEHFPHARLIMIKQSLAAL